MLVATFLLGGWIAVMERGSPHKRKFRSDGAALPTFDYTTVDAISITSKLGDVRLAKVGEEWRMVKPVEDKPFLERMEGLFKALVAPNSIRYISAKERKLENRSLDQYGLDESGRIVVSLTSKNSTVAKYAVGSPGSMENTVYIQVLGPKQSDGVHLLNSNPQEDWLLRELVDAPASVWRDPVLVRIAVGKVNAVEARKGEDVLRMLRPSAGQPWYAEIPFRGPVDRSLVDFLIGRIVQLPVQDFLVGEKATKAEEILKNPAIALKIEEEGGRKPTQIDLAPSEDKARWFARSTQRSIIGEVATEGLEPLTYSWGAYRDRQLGHVKIAELSGMDIEPHNRESVSVDQFGNTWFFRGENGNPGPPANGDKALKLVNGINGAQVISFLTLESEENLTEFGLDKPLRIRFRYDETPGKEDILALGRTGDEQETLYARWNDSSEVAVVPRSVENAITISELNWRGLTIFEKHFTPVALREAVVTRKNRPPLTLRYDRITNNWSASRNGVDMSMSVDRRQATRFAYMIASLTAHEWMRTRPSIVEALNAPSLTISVTFEDPEAQSEDKLTRVRLAFAPISLKAVDPALYYGRVEGSPDIFVIRRQTYFALNRSVMSAAE